MKRLRKRLAPALLALVLCLGLTPAALAETNVSNTWVTATGVTVDGEQSDVTITTAPGNGGYVPAPGSGDNTSGGTFVTVTPDPGSGVANVTRLVGFHANGGTFDNGEEIVYSLVKEVDGTMTADAPTEIPVRYGYKFLGWRGYRAGIDVSYTNTFYAEWKEERQGAYRMAFMRNDGKYEYTHAYTDANGKITALPAPQPLETDADKYEFIGWSSHFARTELVKVGQVLTEDIRLYPVWKTTIKSLIVKLDPKGGTVDPATLEYPTGEFNSVDIEADKLPTPTREGYIFDGWYYGKKKLEKTYGISVLVETITLEAHWHEAPAPDTSVSIHFMPNGGTIQSILGLPASEIFAGSKQASALNSFVDKNSGIAMISLKNAGKLESYPVITRKGYTLEGWYILTSGPEQNQAYDGKLEKFDGLKKADASTVFSEATTLAARWTKGAATCTVTFDLNGGKGSAPAAQTVAVGDTLKQLPTLTKSNAPNGTSTFQYWGYSPDGKTLKRWDVDKNAVAGNLTLYAVWLDSSNSTAPDLTLPVSATASFTDVAPTSPFVSSISWAVQNGITNGTGDGTTFSPNVTCTQAHILTFLWRSQGAPEPTIENPFTDSIPAAFQKAAVWAYEKGLVSGTEFGAAVPCTRKSSVTYMWKLAGSPLAEIPSFKDVPADNAYAQPIGWAVGQGITNGTGDGTTFSPDATCTRGQIVTFLYRAYAKKS